MRLDIWRPFLIFVEAYTPTIMDWTSLVAALAIATVIFLKVYKSFKG